MKIEELEELRVTTPDDYTRIADAILELIEKHNKLIDILSREEFKERTGW